MKHLFLTIICLAQAVSPVEAAFRTSVTKPQTLRKEQRDTFENPIGTHALQERAKEKKKSEEQAKDVSFTHRATGISVKHPYNWEAYNLAKNKGFSVSYGDMVLAVSAEPIPSKKDMSLEEVEKWFMNKSTLSDSNRLIDWYLPSFNLIATEDATLFGKPAKKFTYTGEVHSVKMGFVQYLTSFDQKLYRVRFSTLPEKLESSMPTLEKLFATLKVKQPQTEVAPKKKTRR